MKVIVSKQLGTLTSNTYLDVLTSKLRKEDTGWFYEYLMGAASNFLYIIIPVEGHVVSIKEIENDLFQVGKVLIAIYDNINVYPHPILSTDEKLQTGDLVMLLLYHVRIYVTGSFHLVALRYYRDELKQKPPQERIFKRNQVFLDLRKKYTALDYKHYHMMVYRPRILSLTAEVLKFQI